MRSEIEHRVAQATARQTSSLAAAARVSAASMRADLENHRVLAHRQRGQIAALEHRLSEALGQQISGDLPGPDPVGAADQQLRDRLEAAEQRAFELQESLATAHEELAAVPRSTVSCWPRTTDPVAEAAESNGRVQAVAGNASTARTSSMRRARPSIALANSVTASRDPPATQTRGPRTARG